MTTEFQRGMRFAAQLAELYADENMRMAQDTLLADPILMHPRGRIARMIREEARKGHPRKRVRK